VTWNRTIEDGKLRLREADRNRLPAASPKRAKRMD
jgi:hypothetical protein